MGHVWKPPAPKGRRRDAQTTSATTTTTATTTLNVEEQRLYLKLLLDDSAPQTVSEGATSATLQKAEACDCR